MQRLGSLASRGTSTLVPGATVRAEVAHVVHSTLGDMAEMWRRYGGDVGRCGGDMGEMWGRYGAEVAHVVHSTLVRPGVRVSGQAQGQEDGQGES